MIDKKTLFDIAKLNGLKPWQQEKHYVQSLVLVILSEQPLVFKGGTYLWFFHGLRRFSEDLDFTASGKLPDNLAGIVSKGLGLFGVENKSRLISDNETTLSFRISAKAPLNTADIDECRVYVEISRREAILKKTIPLKFDYPAYQLPIKHLAGMHLDEVCAEKVRALFTRKTSRDVYDLYCLAKNKKAAFDEEAINSKLSYYNLEFSKRLFLQKINSFERHYAKELRPIVLDELPKFTEIRKFLRKWAGNGKS